MGTRDQIDELKQLAAGLETVAEAEDVLMDAKEAYREDKSEENKAAYREAGQKLAEARAAVRGESAARVVAPGDVSLTPATVAATSGKGK